MLLGGGIAGRSFAGENIAARNDLLGGIAFQIQVDGNGLQNCHQLSLVLVNALDLDDEHAARIQADAGALANDARQRYLVLELDLPQRVEHLLVVGEVYQVADLVKFAFRPSRADSRGDELTQPWIGVHQPAPRRDAVGLVVEAFWPKLVKVVEEVLLDQLRVKLSDAVDTEGADRGQVGHADLLDGAMSPGQRTWTVLRKRRLIS